MEAPDPILKTTYPKEKEEDSEKIINIKSWDIKIDNEDYKFEFGKSENNKNIIFKLINNKDFLSKYYILLIDDKELNNLSPLFQMYQNINEIYSLILDAINNQKYSLEKKDLIIILTLKFSILKEKIVSIPFKLTEKKVKKEDLIEKLYLLINQLSEENKSIKENFTKQNKELKNSIKRLEEEMKEKNVEIINIKNELKKLKDKFENKSTIENKSYFNNSKIINKKEEVSKLISWISEKGKIKEINLLYTAQKDGDNYSSFYNKCSNISPTISLIKTSKGRKFGGFTFAKWTDKNGILRLKDPEAFLFSLDNMKNYKILKTNLAIGCYADHSSMLTYGNNADGCGIYLNNNFLSRGGHENHSSKVYNVDSNYCLSNEENFKIEEVEVYNIKFY